MAGSVHAPIVGQVTIDDDEVAVGEIFEVVADQAQAVSLADTGDLHLGMAMPECARTFNRGGLPGFGVQPHPFDALVPGQQTERLTSEGFDGFYCDGHGGEGVRR